MLKLNLEKKSYGLLVFILTTNSIFFLDYQKACSKPFSRGLLQN